jgi:DNA replication protein DnaC
MEKIEFIKIKTDDVKNICSKCKTPKQIIKMIGNTAHIFNIRCECEEREYQARKQAELKAQQEFELRMKAEKLRNNGIAVKQYHSYTLENDDNLTPEITAKIKDYIDNFAKYVLTGEGLMLYGGVGTGKTFLAMCIANALIDKGYKVYATSLSQIARELRDFAKAESRFKSFMDYKLIVLDDLGTESAMPSTMEIIYQVIDGWTSRNIPLVITTNLTPEIFEKAASGGASVDTARVSSRILEKCRPIKVNAIKRRELKMKQNRDKWKGENNGN